MNRRCTPAGKMAIYTEAAKRWCWLISSDVNWLTYVYWLTLTNVKLIYIHFVYAALMEDVELKKNENQTNKYTDYGYVNRNSFF